MRVRAPCSREPILGDFTRVFSCLRPKSSLYPMLDSLSEDFTRAYRRSDLSLGATGGRD